MKGDKYRSGDFTVEVMKDDDNGCTLFYSPDPKPKDPVFMVLKAYISAHKQALRYLVQHVRDLHETVREGSRFR